ncbi:hypothetical protein ES708_09576 [subsurface metagenome]
MIRKNIRKPKKRATPVQFIPPPPYGYDVIKPEFRKCIRCDSPNYGFLICQECGNSFSV